MPSRGVHSMDRWREMLLEKVGGKEKIENLGDIFFIGKLLRNAWHRI